MNLKKFNNFTITFPLYFFVFLSIFYISTAEYLPRINPIILKTRFAEDDAFILSGIKFSEEEGLSSYGGMIVGFSPGNEYTSDSINKNLYEKTLEINRDYLNGNYDNAYYSKFDLFTYSRESGVYSRFLPFIVDKLNIFNISRSLFVENMYLIISILCFMYILQKVKNSFGTFSFIIFFFFHIFCYFFILNIKAYSMPYFVNIIPLLAGLNYERFPNKNSSKVFYFSIIFLLTFLMNVHSGIVLILSFLTGVYIKGKKNIFKNFLKKNLKLLIISNFLAFGLSQFLVISQNILFNNYTLREGINNQLFGYLKRTRDNSIPGTCSDGSYADVFIEYFYLKIYDFLLFEIKIYHLILLTLILLLVSLSYKEEDNIYFGKFTLYSIFGTFLMLAFFKGHSLCHTHMQPKIFLYSFIPNFSILVTSSLVTIFKKLKN